MNDLTFARWGTFDEYPADVRAERREAAVAFGGGNACVRPLERPQCSAVTNGGLTARVLAWEFNAF
jgi:hypothetical protein